MSSVSSVSFESACTLLAQTGLDHSDLTAEKLTNFFGVTKGENLIGMIGMECYPPVGLIRSLAVATDARGAGLGGQLLIHLEKQAREMSIRELYLLTNSASGFFLRHGYQVVDRSVAPPAICATQQFNSLCPASAVLMKKSLF